MWVIDTRISRFTSSGLCIRKQVEDNSTILYIILVSGRRWNDDTTSRKLCL